MEPFSSLTVVDLQGVADTCTCFNLRKASRLITRFYAEMLKPTGLVNTQFTILAAVALAETGAVASNTMSHLATGLGMDRTTLTRNLKPLERDGLLQIQPGQDQRERVVSLTPAGQERLAQAFPLWQQAQTQVIAALGQQDWEQLLAEVTKTVSTLETL
ncbi:MAG: MarR family winged helix-turn-helix transcriptional regulator [Elainella sp.]